MCDALNTVESDTGIVTAYYPRTDTTLEGKFVEVIKALQKAHPEIENRDDGTPRGKSDEILAILAPYLEKIGFKVERSKKKRDLIRIRVLSETNGDVKKEFYVDARSDNGEGDFVIEVEAGQGYDNKNFLKDFFEACVMQGVDYLAIIVLNNYRGNNDFKSITTWFDALYESKRLKVPLKGMLIIGY